MKKKDVRRLRDILQRIEANVHNDRNNDNQKSITISLIKEGVELCNEKLNKLKPGN
ncbi:hypothetical protein [Spirosoma litoris]